MFVHILCGLSKQDLCTSVLNQTLEPFCAGGPSMRLCILQKSTGELSQFSLDRLPMLNDGELSQFNLAGLPCLISQRSSLFI